ncbi:hypothetical protein PUNSTDRAFT_133002 [Punctularia strigosozonata HHB-11173 SS5]|uniref:uncharacterized protein n=1 Tax=Punctularia strigosozonata (strain HHB-11173) TaxID=741275 RepID=UPI000441835E|nr:uncharacterized protein PUNSTDRAFT_133002 [Punctularia strigosozonata HHB-11173 SS5]EIN10940.1 hypothetical protein PUNSTDRAFT_133002 [Punctularia strigosozonata HHB-11173 SS5]
MPMMYCKSTVGYLLLSLSVLCGSSAVPPRASAPAEPIPSLAFSTTLAGKTFVNKGLVAFGLIPSNFTESTGDTIGGIGSAIALKRGSFQRHANGTYTGTIIVQPDRGFNVITTINYQGRQHSIDFTLTPYYGTSALSFSDAQQTLKLNYKSTLLYFDRGHVKTSGLDALGIRPAEDGSPQDSLADPVMPIPNSTFNHLSVDAEGLVLNADGSFWTSDEYGPYIYRFSPEGDLLQAIQPPAAFLPENKKGNINFTSVTDPTTGRAGNQGFEGLTASPDGCTLYALLQSATIQDGGDSKSTSRYTRLLAYYIPATTSTRPQLIGEWVVPLPQNSKGNTLAQSEMHFLSPTTFLVLARDGKGHGDDDTSSSYKQADLIDISNATDIHATRFDDPANPIAKKGKLDSAITPATYVPFVSLINDTQLARFSLHNGDPANAQLIDAKWESLALAPVGDPAFPHDYFLFTAADNDFITTDGISLGQPYNAGLDNDNQFMVFRVTLPTVAAGSVQRAIGIE